MAFNPFEAFSIRSKLGRAVMAVLGIVVDADVRPVDRRGRPGQRLLRPDRVLFDTKSRGEVVAVAYGDDIHDSDLREINRQRQAANEFLGQAIDVSYVNWAKELKRDLEGSRISNETKQAVAPFVNLKANSQTDQCAYFAFLGNQQQLQRLMFVQFLTRRMRSNKKLLDAVFASVVPLIRRRRQGCPRSSRTWDGKRTGTVWTLPRC